jgi:septum formation protein
MSFDVVSPDVNESLLAGEAPLYTSQRLSKSKAQATVAQLTALPQWQDIDLVVIGSDQVAELHGQAMGKPGTHEKAVAQLQAMRGQVVRFHTSVTVLRPGLGFEAHASSTSMVTVRQLNDCDIDTYLRIERPYDCAGSAKAEGLGICLLERIESDDPTALIGLPLIATARLLREAGVDPLAWLARA